MPKEKTGAPAAAEQPDFVHITVPKGFAHPYSFTDQNGKEWNKAIINIPPGTKANGIDLTGYSMATFLNSFQLGQIGSFHRFRALPPWKAASKDRKANNPFQGTSRAKAL